MSENVLPMFSSGVLWCHVLCLSQFEFIFVYAKSVCSNFTLIYMRLTFPTPLAKQTVFFPLSTLASGNWFLRISTCHLFNYKD